MDNETIADPVATPPETTTFDVFVEDEFGCKDTASITVFLKTFFCEEPYIFVPNAFTPDDDGINDVFYVRGNSVDELFLAVYNRWGQKVFETNDPRGTWDGTIKGVLAPTDYYHYLIRYKGRQTSRKYEGGIVLLIE